MRTIFIILMVLVMFVVAAIAILNSEVVTVNYLLGQIDLNLFAVILGSALAGVIAMVFFMIYRSIHNYIKTESDRNLKKELHHQIRNLENENKRLENEISRLQREREVAGEKARAELEKEKKRLEDELGRQQQDRESLAAKEQAEMDSEKRQLEEELRKQHKEKERLAAQASGDAPAKKGLFGFFSRFTKSG